MSKNVSYEYSEQKKKLFDKWKSTINLQGTPFITDGVVNPDVYFFQKVRPLFLLKEAYGGETDWDLVEKYLISEETIFKPWKRISLWTKGILNSSATHLEQYSPTDSELNKFNNKYLNKIAVVNVKKYNGKSFSNLQEIEKIAVEEKKFLKKQLEICDPTIIICGYTAESLSKITDIDFKQNKNEDLFYFINLNGHEVLVLDYWHPANQYPEIMNYYTLIAIYQKALLSQNK